MSHLLGINSYKVFMQTINTYLGTFYQWGGDDPSSWDCSGVVIEGLKSAGVLDDNYDGTANDIWHLFADKIVIEPVQGTLIFRFNDEGKATHIGVCLNEDFYIAAEGGGSYIKTIEDAKKHNAFIKIRPITKIKNPRYVDPWNQNVWRVGCE